ncbi:hypothetical protein BC830DRAFT_1091547 [Chytriomyces sp. MP71]|nr:hypothetical protein BC830DRAFT_1091547 [Chytriomyces sp. MP71]
MDFTKQRQGLKNDSSITLTEDVFPVLPKLDPAEDTPFSHIVNLDVQSSDLRFDTRLSISECLAPSSTEPSPPSTRNQIATPEHIIQSNTTTQPLHLLHRVSSWSLRSSPTATSIPKAGSITTDSYTNTLNAISNKHKLAADAAFYRDRDPARALPLYTAAIEACLAPDPGQIARFLHVNSAVLRHKLWRRALWRPTGVVEALELEVATAYGVVQPVAPDPGLFLARAQCKEAVGDFCGAWSDCDVLMEGVFGEVMNLAASSRADADLLILEARLVRGRVRRAAGELAGALRDFQACGRGIEALRGVRVTRRWMEIQVTDAVVVQSLAVAMEDGNERKGGNWFSLQNDPSDTDARETHRLHSRILSLLHSLTNGILQWRAENPETEPTWHPQDSIGILDPDLHEAARHLSALSRLRDPRARTLLRILGGCEELVKACGPGSVHLVLPILAGAAESPGIALTLQLSLGKVLRDAGISTGWFAPDHELTASLLPSAVKLVAACYAEEGCLEAVVRGWMNGGRQNLETWCLFWRLSVRLLKDSVLEFSVELEEGCGPRAAPSLVSSLVGALERIVSFQPHGLEFLVDVVGVPVGDILEATSGWIGALPGLFGAKRFGKTLFMVALGLLEERQADALLCRPTIEALSCSLQDFEAQESEIHFLDSESKSGDCEPSLSTLIQVCSEKVESILRKP